MKNLNRVILSGLLALLVVGCRTTQSGDKTKPAAPRHSSPTTGKSPRTTSATAPAAPQANTKVDERTAPAPEPPLAPERKAVASERTQALAGVWAKRWLVASASAGGVPEYRIAVSSEGTLSISADGVSINETRFDGAQLKWTERVDNSKVELTARVQPDSRTLVGASWDDELKIGRKFRMEKISD